MDCSKSTYVVQAVADPASYATSFGYSGTYYDYACAIAKERDKLAELVNLDIAENEVKDILTQARSVGYRLSGAMHWIVKAIQMIKEI